MEENVEGLNNQKDKNAEGGKGNKQEIKTRRKILNLLEKAFAIEWKGTWECFTFFAVLHIIKPISHQVLQESTRLNQITILTNALSKL